MMVGTPLVRTSRKKEHKGDDECDGDDENSCWERLSPLDSDEREPCLYSRKKSSMHNQSFFYQRKEEWPRSKSVVVAAKKYHNQSLVVILAIVLLVGVCILTGFVTSVTEKTTSFSRIERKFMNKIQRMYQRRYRKCTASSSKHFYDDEDDSCRRGSMIIFALQCKDGLAKVLVDQYLAPFKPILVCADQTPTSSSLQEIMDGQYDLVILQSLPTAEYRTHLDFWKTMLLPHGFIGVATKAKLISEKPRKQEQSPIMINIAPFTSKEEADLFLDRVEYMYKMHICNPLNKNGFFCQGKVLSLNCDKDSGPQELVQGHLPGRATHVCTQIQTRNTTAEGSGPFCKQTTLQDLLYGRYELIMLEGSNKGTVNLKLWSQLLAPGGIIAISGTLLDPNLVVADQRLPSLKLKTTNQPTIFVNKAGKNQVQVVAQDESIVQENYEPNEGSVNNQIQLSPMSHEDRYPILYTHVSNNLLRGSTCSNDESMRNENPSCPLKVLSFGCSYGFEMKSLADKYLTGKADIYGVDLNEPVIERARENVKVVQTNKMVVLNGKTDPAYNYGPFDAVFANSVLCYNKFPEPDDPVADIRKMFPFQVFEELLGDIDRLVKVGGLLSLDNANYQFHETELFRKKYQIYGEDEAPLCRQEVWLLAADGHKVIFNPHTGNRGAYTVRCLFVKIHE